MVLLSSIRFVLLCFFCSIVQNFPLFYLIKPTMNCLEIYICVCCTTNWFLFICPITYAIFPFSKQCPLLSVQVHNFFGYIIFLSFWCFIFTHSTSFVRTRKVFHLFNFDDFCYCAFRERTHAAVDDIGNS